MLFWVGFLLLIQLIGAIFKNIIFSESYFIFWWKYYFCRRQNNSFLIANTFNLYHKFLILFNLSLNYFFYLNGYTSFCNSCSAFFFMTIISFSFGSSYNAASHIFRVSEYLIISNKLEAHLRYGFTKFGLLSIESRQS